MSSHGSSLPRCEETAAVVNLEQGYTSSRPARNAAIKAVQNSS
jgi:hypothetical protein